MLRRNIGLGLSLTLIGILCASALITAASDDLRVANAAMKGDKDAIRTLVKQAADVNAAQADGMTALHWAALNGDADMTQMLVYAGASVRATTRIGGYTPLFMAARSGSAPIIDILLKAGSDTKLKGSDGLTPLMMAAMAGNRDSVRLLLEQGSDVNARESEHGQTPLIFAAAFDRSDAIEELVKHGADLNLATEVQAPAPPPVSRSGSSQAIAAFNAQQAASRGGQPAAPPAAAPPPPPPPPPADSSKGGGNPHGGLTPLMYAARDGNLRALQVLVQSKANLNLKSGDRSTAVLLATINGHFDAAKYLVEQGADLNITSLDGAGPLFTVVHTQWSRESFHPQPTTKQEKTSYLDLMKLMLDHGADPNARLTRVLWYSSYGYAYEAASEIGTTTFWKCAEVADIDGMKLLLSRGADKNIPNKDGINALLIASGAGTHGNDDVMAPPGRLEAVKYLVEDLHFDVNAADNGVAPRGEGLPVPPPTTTAQPPQTQQNPFGGLAAGGYTALHNAASRGDNEMILYLVSKGARPDAVTRSGVTVVDMANGPRQRVQPYASTIALLEMLGAKNSHKCVSC